MYHIVCVLSQFDFYLEINRLQYIRGQAAVVGNVWLVIILDAYLTM